MALLGGNLSKWGGMLYIEYITGLLTVHGWHSVFPHLTTGGVGGLVVVLLHCGIVVQWRNKGSLDTTLLSQLR